MPALIYPQFWDDLTKEQAIEIFDAYVEEHPTRVASALRRFASLRLSDDAMDFTSRSLERLWPEVLADVIIPAQITHDWEQADMAPWAAFRPEESRRVGPAVIDTVACLAAYFSECVLRADTRSRFRLGDQKNASGYRKPLLAFPSGADLSAEELVQKILLRALEGQGIERRARRRSGRIAAAHGPPLETALIDWFRSPRSPVRGSSGGKQPLPRHVRARGGRTKRRGSHETRS